MTSWLPPTGLWSVHAEDIHVLDTPEERDPYRPLLDSASPLLALPKKFARHAENTGAGAYNNDDDSGDGDEEGGPGLVQLGLFSAHTLEAAPLREPQAATTGSRGKSAKSGPDCCIDAVAFAGGLVWCADFCPPPRGVPTQSLRAPGAPGQPTSPAGTPPVARGIAAAAGAVAGEEYVVLGSHPPGDSSHLTNTPVSGPGAVQLWAVPHGAVSPSCPQGLPRCALLLPHDGRVAWDVRWCPSPGCIWADPPTQQPQTQPQAQARARPQQMPAAPTELPVVGLLAMVLGDGRVVVTAVPDPVAIAAWAKDAAAEPETEFQVPETAAMKVDPGAHPGTTRSGGGGTTGRAAGGGRGRAGADADGDGPEAMEGVEAGAAAPAAGAAAANTPAEGLPRRGRGVPSGPAAPLVRLLRPAVVLWRESVGGALPSCCDWHLPDPRVSPPQLLVGAWDGSVALWRLPRGVGSPGAAGLERTQLLFHIPADVLPLRRVVSNPVWDTDFPPPDSDPDSDGTLANATAGAPASASASASSTSLSSYASAGCGLSGRRGHQGGPAGHMFCTTGYTGRVKLWDDRDVSRPLLDRIIHRSYAHDATWTRRPSALALAQDDGGLRVVLLDAAAALFKDDGGSAGSVAFKELGCGSLWSACYSPALHALLYGGVDGLVGVMAWELPSDPRNRRCHVPLAGLVRDGPHLRLLGPQDVRGIQLFYPGGTAWRTPEAPSRPRPPHIIPDVQQQLHVIRAGYGNPAERRWAPPGEPDVGRGGAGSLGAAAQRPKAKGRPSAAMMEAWKAAAADDEARGGAVWVMMAWRCGVVRFMRVSFE